MKTIILICLAMLISALHTLAEDKEERSRKLYLFFEGREIYQSQCLPCHGSGGKGDGDWAKDWTKDRPRNFRTGVFKFRTTPMGFLPTDEDLKRTITCGISGTAMPTFKGHLSDDKMDAVITYIKSFSRKWKDETKQAEPVAIPEKPDWIKTGHQKSKHTEAGKLLFATHCAACHGESGKGDGPAAAELKDIWQFDIRPADLSSKHHKSGDSTEDLYRTVSMGLDGTPMVGYLGILTEEQIWQVVVFARQLKNQKSEAPGAQ